MQNDARHSRQFETLVVEDDPESLEEYCELLAGLGYVCLKASNGAEALKLLSQHTAIGIVLTDISMPIMDGLTLLGELQARFTPFRPIVPVVITGMANLETAIEAMRTDAIDFLPKPVSLPKLAATLRRASARWNMLQGQFRLISLIEQGNSTASPPTVESGATKPDRTMPDRELLRKYLRTIVKARRRRLDFMDATKFSDPSWDILLDLTSAALEGRSVPIISASAAANVPITTALRYIHQLVETGAIKRWDDPTDKRRSLLALEDQMLEKMLNYLTSTWNSMAADAFYSADQ